MKKGTQEQQERLSKLNIQEMYPDECNKFDMIIHMEVWDLYFENKPACGDFIKLKDTAKMIKEVSNDGVAYFINLYE
jgi:hypothetical protein